MNINKREKQAFEELEKILLSSKEINPKAVDMIERQFTMYSYLKGLIEMRKENNL